MSPWQDWPWNLSLKPLGPETVWGEEKTLRRKKACSLAALGQLRDPSRQPLPLPTEGTDPEVEGRVDPRPPRPECRTASQAPKCLWGTSSGSERSSHMFKVTQRPGHRGAKCFPRWVVAYSPALTILPADLCISIFSSSLFSPILPPRPPLPCPPCPSFVLRLPCICLLASLPCLPTFLCLLHPHPSLTVSPVSTGPS